MRNTVRLGKAAGVILGLGLSCAAGAEPILLVATNAAWRWTKGTTDPSPGEATAWRTAAFPDGAWTESAAPFWYGEAALFGGTGTELTDMQNSYSTLFLRTRFTVHQPSLFGSLRLAAMCDDGFVAWLNGQRVASSLAPAGDPAFNALATGNAAEPVSYTTFPLPDPATALVAGENVLAVQVLNTSLGSSDLVFAAELSAEAELPPAPTILAVDPPPGPVSTLDRITVTFSEPVRGVDAEHFLVNGLSATGVGGGGATYTFTFAPVAYGSVQVSWSTFQTIEDLDTPPRRFEIGAPGSFWTYELLDPDGPALAVRQPPPGTTVGALTQVEVTFDKAVTGVDAGDLALNGRPAIAVSGFGAGPYLFEFPPASAGPATLAWTAGHGIASDALEPHPFAGGDWGYDVDPQSRPAALAITEFMAENLTALRDEDKDPEDWVEIHNPTGAAVNLEGWSLSNDADDPGRWVFPPVGLAPGARLIVFASAKDRRPAGFGQRLHTNFKLNPNGGYLGLFAPELPRKAVSEVRFGRQGANHSQGRENDIGEWRFFLVGSPGTSNGTSPIRTAVEDVRFSVPRGFFASAFNLTLSCPTPGAEIRFTTNGSPPTAAEGFVYTNAVPITGSRVIRAAAFKTNAMPSGIGTHTYLLGQAGSRLRLPAVSLVTATNNLFGRTGIMEVSPRNTTKRGPAWERPVSVEFIRPEDNGGFQADCGLRLQGGDYVRGQYNYRTTALPFSKYSFRLYFRGEYGQGRLKFPLFPETTQESFDTVVLRAGMNDASNPFLTDEVVRTLARDCGQPGAVGTFVHLFLNGVYKGYYNPTERIDIDFLRAYHGGGEKWDVIAQMGEVREGDATAWNTLRTLVNTRDLTAPANYLEVTGRLDVTNFVDYLCPLIYVDNDDWPHNNWRAARERVTGGLYRFYVWDAEWAFGVVNGHSPTWDTIRNQLSSTAPPWGGTDVQRLFLGLKKSPEFRLLFADRVHRHWYNDGALTDARLKARYADVTNRLKGVVSGFNNRIGSTWIPQRRVQVLSHLNRAGLLASSNAPVFNQFGGRVPAGFALSMLNLSGAIHYTTNGADPRTAFTGGVTPGALTYTAPLVLTEPLLLRARSLDGTNWSALTEAAFQIDRLESPIRITEIMYHPVGGDAFEFLELANLGGTPWDLGGASFTGIDFRFPEPFPPLAPGAHLVLASDARPGDFQARYPAVTPAGWFGGSLNNAGERLELRDRDGRVITAVTYGDSPPWPARADGRGASLELADPDLDPGDPAAWIAGPADGGSPGAALSPTPPVLRFTEIAPGNPDWIELRNFGDTTIALGGWSVSDSSDTARFVFPAGTALAGRTLLRLWCGPGAPAGALATTFGLDREGETLALYDAAGERVDAVTFGLVPDGYSLGRLGASTTWELTEPTPLAANEPAALAGADRLSLNEWMAAPLAGDDDWIEVHNQDPLAPVALHGTYFTTSNALFRVRAHTFVPPSGFLVLRADEAPGPNHLGFRLPASGGMIAFHDASGQELTRVTYRAMSEGISLGRVPDGTGAPVALPGTASPGASNYVAAADGPRFNEFMAHNTGRVPGPDGRPVDWLEIHNPRPTATDLAGFSLSLGDARPGEWRFPAGARIPARGHLVVWCDPDRPASTNLAAPLNLGRGLPREGGTVWFFNAAAQWLDTLRYGRQLENEAAGLDGSTWTLLAAPTPGGANAGAVPLASRADLRLNEWHAGDASGDDWLEVFNPAPLPVDAGGCSLTDDPSLAGIFKAELAPLTFLAAGGHALFRADGRPEEGPDHLPFRLDPRGETLRLYLPSRALVDSVDYAALPGGSAAGRFPDGAADQAVFRDSASPGESNWLPHPGLVVTEVLSHTDPPLEDAVEVYNDSPTPVDLSRWSLSNSSRDLFRIPLRPGVVVPPGGTHVIYEYEFNPPADPGAFTLNSAHGDDVWLTERDAGGAPTGYRAHVRFEAAANGVSFGRHRTSQGWEFPPLSRRTFGKDRPSTLAEFRQGTGLPNAYPLVGPVVLTEIHYRPLAGTPPDTAEVPGDEFVELHNSGASTLALFDPAVPANTWRLRGGVAFDFPPGILLPRGGYALVVNFAPTNATAAAAFRARLGVDPAVPLFGPFAGRLSNEEDDLRLERPDTPQAPTAPDAGYVPYLLVEHVRYRATFPWPAEPLLLGHSLQRRRVAEYANDPANWIAGPPSPGRATPPPVSDRDFDGLPNDWETAFGLNPDDPADALLDADGDRFTNLDEFTAGTDPQDPASALQLKVVLEPSAGLILRFRAVANRSYSVLGREDVALGAWQTHLDVAAEPYDRDVSLPLAEPAGPAARFLRLVTPSAP